MARTAITGVTAFPNGATTQPAPVAIDQANGMVVPAEPASTYGVFPRPASGNRKILIIANTFAGVKTVTFRAGVNPPAFRAPIGDMTLSVPASTTVYVPMPEAARFAQADGSINVDFQSGITGTITFVGVAPGA
jgi:hypothetical protein